MSLDEAEEVDGRVEFSVAADALHVGKYVTTVAQSGAARKAAPAPLIS